MEKSIFEKDLEECQKYGYNSFERILDEINVEEIDEGVFVDMYGVSGPHGYIGYFKEEKEACRFRLDYINRLLNN